MFSYQAGHRRRRDRRGRVCINRESKQSGGNAMTSSVAKTLAIGSCAFVLLALAEMARAQTASVAPRPVQLPPCDYDGQTVSVTLNTGTVLPVGLADPIWNVSPGFTAYSTTPATGWLANQATAKWVQP